MSQWGRGPDGAAGIAGAPIAYLAKRSILCAVMAYVIAVAAIIVWMRMPADTPPWLSLAVGVLFAIVVPLIHVIGIVYGARALSKPNESRLVAGFGIALNLLSLAVVVAL